MNVRRRYQMGVLLVQKVIWLICTSTLHHKLISVTPRLQNELLAILLCTTHRDGNGAEYYREVE